MSALIIDVSCFHVYLLPTYYTERLYNNCGLWLQGSPKDVDLLHNSLEWRVAASRAHTHEEAASEGTKKAKTEGKTSPAVPL